MMERLEAVGKVLRENGVGEWDIYAQEFSACELHLRNYDLEILRSPITNFGYAVRVIDRRAPNVGIGISTGSSTSKPAVEKCLKDASARARITNFPRYEISEKSSHSNVKIADQHIVSNPEGVTKDKAEEFLSLVSKEKQVTPSFGKLRAMVIKTAVLNSKGLEAEKEETAFYMEVAMKAQENGRLSEYWPIILKRRADEIPLEEKVPEWTKVTRDALSARSPDTKKMTVIFPPSVLSDIIPQVVGFHGAGSNLYKKLSRFSVGGRIGDSTLTVSDDGLYDYGLASSPFDDEGTPQRKTPLIEKGVFKSYLYDNMYAAIMERESTGNGLKGFPGMGMEIKYASSISTRPTNIVVEPGDQSREELLGEVKEGLYVERFSWMLVDPITGSFGSEIRNGYMIRDGEFSEPVKGGAISGQALDGLNAENQPVKGLFSQVTGIGRDVDIAGSLVSPTMRFEGVQVAGK